MTYPFIPRELSQPLDRITWRDGQLLTARDLREDERTIERLRHLHVRYLHRTWGVVEGLGVSAVSITTAAISPGYALDVEGRELLVPVATTITAPYTASFTGLYLVISYLDRDENDRGGRCSCKQTPEIDRTVLCIGGGNAVAMIHGYLTWLSADEVRFGFDVPLARAHVNAGKFVGPIDTSIQRQAGSMAQPKTWSDSTEAGHTGWTDATFAGTKAIQVTIDTSDAGFVSTPAYFARVGSSVGLNSSFIAAATRSSFTLIMHHITPISAGTHAAISTNFNAAVAERAGVTVSWLAIEYNI